MTGDPNLDQALRAFVEGEILDPVVASGCAAALGRGSETLGVCSGGTLFSGPGAPVVTPDTLWDLASLTKVLVTAPLLIEATAREELSLATPLGSVVPELSDTVIGGTSLQRLATHTAGLEAELALGETGDLVSALASATVAEASVHYSDIGYIALGVALERAGGADLADLAAERLGLVPQGAEYASTQPGRASDGRPHDPVAKRAGRLCGHAGAFSDLRGTVRLLLRWVGKDHRHHHRYREGMNLCTQGIPGGRRGLGWCLQGDPYAITNDQWPFRTVSHSGFTGTAVVLDPETEQWAVMLTNSVAHSQTGTSVAMLRRFADMSATWLGSTTGLPHPQRAGEGTGS